MSFSWPKVVLLALVVIVFMVMTSLAQEMNRRWQIQHEVEKLEAQVAELEQSISDLSNLNEYFKTDAFQEKVAREKLNYVAEGEQVVLIPNQPGQAEAAEVVEEEPQYSTPEKWWRLFFLPREA